MSEVEKRRVGVICVPLEAIILNPAHMGAVLEKMDLKLISSKVMEGNVYYLGISKLFDNSEQLDESPVPTYDIEVMFEEGKLQVRVQHSAKEKADSIITGLKNQATKEM